MISIYYHIYYYYYWWWSYVHGHAHVGKAYNQAEKSATDTAKSLDTLTPKLAEVVAKLKSVNKRKQEQEVKEESAARSEECKVEEAR